MTELIIFHHAQGRTSGVLDLAEHLAGAGHVVHTPDLYDGLVFDTLEEGIAHAKRIGDAFTERARAAAIELPQRIVYAGWSLGVMPAQQLTQTRPGAVGALLIEAFVPPSYFGEWPAGVPAQVHGMADDEWFAEDLAAAHDFAETSDDVELLVYPGDQHLFGDSSLPSYDDSAAEAMRKRVLEFLDRLG